jgi:hypothetical protein|tara:strand:- start:54 stop:1094 length:1041 start_codon:yes stop_codon:yes gene_type:complete
MKEKIVFISYAWDTEEHNKWVLKLVDYLIEEGGLEVIIDQYDLKPGGDLNYFMESGLERADKVIMILTPKYKIKADNREGGTGFENSIISSNLYEIQNETNDKFIPVLKSGTKKESAPTYLKSRVYHSMTVPEDFEFDALNLLKVIYGYSDKKKPTKGKIPNFENIENEKDPVLKIANEVSQKEKINSKLNRLKSSGEGVELAKKLRDELFSMISNKAKLYTDKTDFHFHFETNSTNNEATINALKHSASLAFNINSYDFANDIILHLKLWYGNVRVTQGNHFYFPTETPETVIETEYQFDFNINQQPIWRNPKGNEVNNQSISQSIFEYLIQAIHKERSKKFRES